MALLLATITVSMSLLVVCTTQAAITVEQGTGEQLKGDDILAAVVNTNSTKELFGHTYRQAVFLYRDHSEELQALKELPELVKRLKNELDDLTNTNKIDVRIKPVQPAAKQNYKDTLELLAQQLNIKKMVMEYDNTKDWRALRKGLESVLDHDSAAYKQLQKISWSESYPPWQIAYDGHKELVSVLVFAGRGINMTDRSRDNLLHGAVAGGEEDLVKMLLDNGADIESRNEWGNAPMALACKYRRLGVAQVLWTRGAELDGINYYEKWAGLHRAVDNNDLEIVRFMVKAGASTTIKDREGLTPYGLAQRKKFLSVTEFLSQFPH